MGKTQKTRKIRKRKIGVDILRGIAIKLRTTTELFKSGESTHSELVNEFEALTQQLEKVVED